MSDNAAPVETSAAPEGAPANGAAAPAPDAAPAGAPPAADKPAAAAKPSPFTQALKVEKNARDKVKAVETKAKGEVEAAKARVAEMEAKLAEVGPLLDLLSKKDARALLAHMGLSAVDVAHLVADEGKPPTLEEIEARATDKALKAVGAEQKKRDEAAAEAKKKADAEALEATQKAQDERFMKAVGKEFASLETELKAAGEGGAAKYAHLTVLDKLLPALGVDKGVSRIDLPPASDGTVKTIKLQGGTASQRAALELIIAAADRGERVTVAEALETVQKQALPVLRELLQQIAEQPPVGGQPGKQNDQKKNGGAAQPSLTARQTTAPVVAPRGEDHAPAQTGAPMSAVLAAMARAGVKNQPEA